MLVCMYVCRPEIVLNVSFSFCFFPPNNAHFSCFLMVAWEKKTEKVSFYGVCMYVRPKLTFASFYFCFFCTFPLNASKKHNENIIRAAGQWVSFVNCIKLHIFADDEYGLAVTGRSQSLIFFGFCLRFTVWLDPEEGDEDDKREEDDETDKQVPDQLRSFLG